MTGANNQGDDLQVGCSPPLLQPISTSRTRAALTHHGLDRTLRPKIVPPPGPLRQSAWVVQACAVQLASFTHTLPGPEQPSPGVPKLKQVGILSGYVLVAAAPSRRRVVVVYPITGGDEPPPPLRIAVLDTDSGTVETDEPLGITPTTGALTSLAVSPDGLRVVFGSGSFVYVLRPESGLLAN